MTKAEKKPAAARQTRLFQSIFLAVVLTPLLAGLFALLLAASLTIPDEAIAKNIAEDAELFEHARIHSFSGRKIDVGTECIGVSFGLGDNYGSAFEAAARSPVFFDCPAMIGFVQQNEGASGDYTHYWHGYAALSRPFLAMFAYHDLRMLTFNAMAGLFAFLAIGLAKRGGWRLALAALAPFYFVNYAGFFELWTKAAGWMVMLIAANVIVRTEWTKDRRPYLLFFFTGATTAYVDLLATPLLVFGFPASLYFILASRSGALPPRAQLKALASIGGFWILGFAGLWSAKIFIAAAVLGQDVWHATLEAAKFRINGEYESVKHFIGAATLENLEAFKGLWGAAAIVTFFIIPLARAGGLARLFKLARQSPGVVLIAVSPFIWYEVLSNHSQIHGLFTHANLVLTFLPFSLVLAGASDLRPIAEQVATNDSPQRGNTPPKLS